MGCGPAGRAEVVIDAAPDGPTGAEPSVVAPSVKVTVPVVWTGPDTVAVSVSEPPVATGFGCAARVVALAPWSTWIAAPWSPEPNALVARTTKEKSPASVGVPDRAPDGDSVTPGGSEPATRDTEPVVVNEKEFGVPTV